MALHQVADLFKKTRSDACPVGTPLAVGVPSSAMPKNCWSFAALAVALLTINSDAGPIAVAPGRILVKTKRDDRPEIINAAIRPFSGAEVDRIPGLGVHILQVPEAAWLQALDGLSRNPEVEFAEPDFLVEPDFVPNDPSYTNQWHLPKIQANTAWDKTTGSAKVIIAILDTGVDSTHPDLVSRLVPGWNFYDGNSDTTDVYGHGTAVAGTAAAALNNGVGVAGVAGGCKIMPIRVTDTSGLAYESTMAQGLNWAADHGARVANMSFRLSDSSTVTTAAQYFQSKGGVVTVSAGNEKLFDSAADNPYVLTVSATDKTDAIASFSNTGNNIDLAAPGVSILTTSRGGGYGYWSGTSFSAPLTAGAAALVLSVNPNLTGAQAADVVRKSADDLSTIGFDTKYGYGRLNVSKAVNTALSMLPNPPPNPPPTGTQEAITARSGGTLQNDYSGPFGFRFVAAANATVTKLGRWVVAGNTGTHTVKLMDSALAALGTVTVNTLGATANQMAYATLSSPVSLTAGQTYFLMSFETSNGDNWYYNNQTITENTAVISQMTSACCGGSTSAGDSYGPVGFTFTTSSSPPPPIGTQDAITARSGGTLLNDYSGPFGFRFVAAANATVTELGRWVVAGNSGAHTVKLMDSALTALGTVTVNTLGATANQMAYASLSSPVSLTAGQTYFLMSFETSNGDNWYYNNQTITENTAVISQMTSACCGGSTAAGESYGPPGFKFTIP